MRLRAPSPFPTVFRASCLGGLPPDPPLEPPPQPATARATAAPTPAMVTRRLLGMRMPFVLSCFVDADFVLGGGGSVPSVELLDPVLVLPVPDELEPRVPIAKDVHGGRPEVLLEGDERS